MKTAIKQTKDIILAYYEEKRYSNPNYNRIYLFTNENVNAYLKAAEFQPGQKALSVLASGDQAFNLIFKGVKDIDTFDINKLTEFYVFGLKMAIITKCNYQEFISTYSTLLNPTTSEDTITAIIYDLLPYMDEKYRVYWKEVLDLFCKNKFDAYANPKIRNLISVIKSEPSSIKAATIRNTYLLNEANYNQFKINLSQANLTFKHSNILDLNQNFNSKYNYLLFSNILDYIWHQWGMMWNMDKLNDFIESLMPLLNDEAIIFLHYCFVDFELMDNSVVKLTDFNQEEVLGFNGTLGGVDYMLLKRIKQKGMI